MTSTAPVKVTPPIASVVTLMSRTLPPSSLASVSTLLESHQLTVESIHALTPEVVDGTRAAVDFIVRGTIADEQALRKQLLEVARAQDCDISLQTSTGIRRQRRLVCFDMDSTLIEAEVIDELAKVAGVGDQVAEITERAMQGELDFQASFRERMALLKGLEESALADIAQRLPIMEGAARLIKTLKGCGYRTAILSGGFTYFGRYLQQKLGIDEVYANELDIVDGRVTGEVKGTIVDGQRKAELLQKLAADAGLPLSRTVAIGDGANDLPMLAKAGLGIAFRAKPIVQAKAEHAITTLGLDGALYYLGFTESEIDAINEAV